MGLLSERVLLYMISIRLLPFINNLRVIVYHKRLVIAKWNPK